MESRTKRTVVCVSRNEHILTHEKQKQIDVKTSHRPAFVADKRRKVAQHAHCTRRKQRLGVELVEEVLRSRLQQLTLEFAKRRFNNVKKNYLN